MLGGAHFGAEPPSTGLPGRVADATIRNGFGTWARHWSRPLPSLEVQTMFHVLDVAEALRGLLERWLNRVFVQALRSRSWI